MNRRLKKYALRHVDTSNRRGFSNFLKKLSITNWLIIINVFFFIVFFSLIAANESFIDYIALKPSNILQGNYIWTILTSMFMHGSPTHLFVNMISLFFVGNFLEKIIGKRRYLPFYLLAGIVAALFFIFLSLIFKADMNAYAVGASGALFGIGGILAVLIPKLRVYVFFIIPMPMWLAMLILMFGVWLISLWASLPIGNTAHFGGLVIGVIYGFYLRNKYKRKVKMLSRFFG